MSLFKNLALPLTVALIIGFAWLLNQSMSQQQQSSAPVNLSPWDGLNASEYHQAAALVTAAHDGKLIFARISLRQPDKAKALAWQAGEIAQRDAEVSFWLMASRVWPMSI